MEEISADKLYAFEKKDCLILDVRTPGEFQGGHIPGALNQPLQNLQAADIERLKGTKKIVVVCKSGSRAKNACEKLLKDGVSDILLLTGGTDAWKSAGYSLESSGQGVISLERQVRIAAGSLVLLGVILGMTVNIAFYFLSAFVGAGLVFSGVTDTCGMALMLTRLPWNRGEGS